MLVDKGLVPFISNEKLVAAVKAVVSKTQAALLHTNIDENILDAFSAMYEALVGGVSYGEWLKLEATRQAQKTMQNAVGEFHQDVIGGIDGWENLGKGNLIDVRNKSKKIIAEIKNKYNTVTGIHLIKIYDELEEALSRNEHRGFMAYHVMMITKDKNHLKSFVPSDRTTHKRRPENDHILEISGFKFYELITGDKDGLLKVFNVIPKILEKECEIKIDNLKDAKELEKIFWRTYR